MADSVLLMVGTRKGAFLFQSDRGRNKWEASGPYFEGSEVFHVACHSGGAGPRVYTAVNQMVWGSEVSVADDLGASWRSLGSPKYAPGLGLTVDQVWHIEPGRPSEPDVVYAGVAPAGLFVSREGGPWQEVVGLNQHPTRDKWQPGLGAFAFTPLPWTLTILGGYLRRRCISDPRRWRNLEPGE